MAHAILWCWYKIQLPLTIEIGKAIFYFSQCYLVLQYYYIKASRMENSDSISVGNELWGGGCLQLKVEHFDNWIRVTSKVLPRCQELSGKKKKRYKSNVLKCLIGRSTDQWALQNPAPSYMPWEGSIYLQLGTILLQKNKYFILHTAA